MSGWDVGIHRYCIRTEELCIGWKPKHVEVFLEVKRTLEVRPLETSNFLKFVVNPDA
jgi:hypothetical protein